MGGTSTFHLSPVVSRICNRAGELHHIVLNPGSHGRGRDLEVSVWHTGGGNAGRTDTQNALRAEEKAYGGHRRQKPALENKEWSEIARYVSHSSLDRAAVKYIEPAHCRAAPVPGARLLAATRSSRSGLIYSTPTPHQGRRYVAGERMSGMAVAHTGLGLARGQLGRRERWDTLDRSPRFINEQAP